MPADAYGIDQDTLLPARQDPRLAARVGLASIVSIVLFVMTWSIRAWA
jgi:hypothetical protein